jgi:hypothetical protein
VRGAQFTGAADPVEVRHPDVHQDYIGCEPASRASLGRSPEWRPLLIDPVSDLSLWSGGNETVRS